MKRDCAISDSPLKKAVECTDDVKGGFRTGLGAVKGCYRQKIITPKNSRLGSLDIDDTTKNIYPADNRWDYAIECDGETFFIEIHPATTSEVSVMIKKLDWLKTWLKEKAPAIDALKPEKKRPYHWVFIDKNTILPTSKYSKMLSKSGLYPVRQWDYSLLR